MGRNGRQQPGRPRIELAGQSASPEEAAAIAAAIEQFLRDTAPPPTAAVLGVGRWQRAGVLEGTGLHPEGPTPWGDPEPWGAGAGGG